MRVTSRRLLVVFGVAAIGLAPALGFATDDFSDVLGTDFFHVSVGNIAAAGVTGGCVAGPPATALYCPNDAVTRGQMAVFLDRVLGNPTPIVNAGTLDGLDSTAFALKATTGQLRLNDADWTRLASTGVQFIPTDERIMSLAGIPDGATLTGVTVRATDASGQESFRIVRQAFIPGGPPPSGDPTVADTFSLYQAAAYYGTTVTERAFTAADLSAAGGLDTLVVDHDSARWFIWNNYGPSTVNGVNVLGITVTYTVP